MKSKRIRINGEGSIIEKQKGRVYLIRHRLPPTEPGGARRWSKARKVVGNKAEARRKLEEYRLELEAELNGDISTDTLAEYVLQWQKRRRTQSQNSGHPRVSTIDREANEVDKIIRYLGEARLSDLESSDFVKLYDELRADGSSQASIHTLHTKCRQILNDAVRDGFIAMNPCDTVPVNETRRPDRQPRNPLTHQQVSEFSHALLQEELDGRVIAVWIALATGARKGEILALRWCDVDLIHGSIMLERGLSAKHGVQDYLKTEEAAGARAIDSKTIALLKKWQEQQSKLFFGNSTVPPDFPVCSSQLGGYQSVSSFDKWRRRLFAKHGLGYFDKPEALWDKNGHKRYKMGKYHGLSLHDLRHTQATVLIADGVDIKTVQARGGWKSTDVPLNIYTHAVERNDRVAAETIAKYLSDIEDADGVFPEIGDGTVFCSSINSMAVTSLEDLIVEPHKPRCLPIAAQEAQTRILGAFKNSGEMLSKREISARCGINSAKCLSKALVALQQQGRLSKVGNTKSSRYKIID